VDFDSATLWLDSLHSECRFRDPSECFFPPRWPAKELRQGQRRFQIEFFKEGATEQRLAV
jgi:hypothetical protein